MIYLPSFILVLCYATISANIFKNNGVFSASVFIFSDEGNRLTLNNELTTLKFWCSGCIIAPTWVLTAASCFNTKETTVQSERYIIVPTKGVTIFQNSKNVESYEVTKIIIDENWKSAVNDVNVALLMLKHAFRFTNNIGKAPLASHAIKAMAHCTSLVWMREPSSRSKDVIFKPRLLSGQVESECRKQKYQNEFCFISKVDDDSCYDIQGSLLMCNHKLQGIASSKYGGADPLCTDKRNSTYLNVHYMDLGMFNTWINNHIDEATLEYNQSRKDLNADNESNNENFPKLFEFLLVFILCSL